MYVYTDKIIKEVVASLAKLEVELAALRDLAVTAEGVVHGTDDDRPISLSTMSLLALAEALAVWDEVRGRQPRGNT